MRARNLAAKDRNGLSDPFVRFQLGKTKAKSATVYKNLNPEWNEEFLFRVEDIANDVLEVTLWDEDFLGMADFLGYVSIPVADIMSAEGQNLPRMWYTLEHKEDRPRGYFISGETARLVDGLPCTLSRERVQGRPLATLSGVTIQPRGYPVVSLEQE